MLEQTRALLLARLQIAKRSKRIFFLHFLSGAFALVLLSTLQTLANSVLTSGVPNPPSDRLPLSLLPCVASPGALRPAANGSEAGCFALLYLPARDDVAELVGGLGAAADVAALPGAVRWPLAPAAAGWVETALLREGATGCEGARGVCAGEGAWATGRCAPCA
jgi:hypothetical protein